MSLWHGREGRLKKGDRQIPFFCCGCLSQATGVKEGVARDDCGNLSEGNRSPLLTGMVGGWCAGEFCRIVSEGKTEALHEDKSEVAFHEV